MPHRFPALKLAARGVIVAPYLSEDGCPILIAISSSGRRVREIVLEPDAPTSTPALLAELDRLDPQRATA